jgi:uncharacterized membrane protein
MKPFFVLVASFTVALLVTWLLHDKADWQLAARIALAIMLVFTSIGHFAFQKGMTMMIPAAIPFKAGIVVITGILEILAAISLHISSLQKLTGWFLIAFFIVLLPANIYAATNRVDYQKATYEGPGLRYLWFRIPFQLFLIAWTYLSAVSN